MQERAEFRVSELDCAEEIPPLKKGLLGRPGILGLDFDILQAKMIVSYESAATGPAEIVALVRATGMHAAPWAAPDRLSSGGSWWRQQARPIMTLLSGAFLLAGLGTHFLLEKSAAVALHGTHPPRVVMGFYLAAIAAGAWFVAPRAWIALSKFRADMHLLMCVAVIGAVAIGEWFEAATVSFLFSLALLLEQWSMGRARRAVESLMDLSPATARFRCPTHGTVEEQRIENVPQGATVLVRPGERIPLDGVVLKGTSHVNEAPITGESLPASKTPGDTLFAGTVNGDGALEFQVTKPAGDTTLARIVHLVQAAQSRRAPAEQWVERFAVWYTPAMMLLALAIALMPPVLFSAAWGEWVYRGLVALVIACPCELVIATPVSIVSALTSAARHGVLIKGGVALEAAARVRAIAMDKTGTLTRGHPEVQQVIPCSGHTSRELLERVQALEVHSRHPLALAVLRKAEAEGIAAPPAEAFRQLSGRGAEGEIQGRPFWIGSHRLMHEKGAETADVHAEALRLEDAGHSVVAVGNAGHVCGLISVADGVRPEARAAIDALRRAGIERIVMLTGDNEATAAEIAKQTGVDDYHAELLPEDKLRQVEALVREFRHVAMIGDGVNDAPAMAAASVSIAMGKVGTDVAIETADIALMADDLSKIPWLIGHARRTLSLIKANIAFALGVKLLFVILTLCGRASLWAAIAADTGATLLVIFNALRLLSGNANTHKSCRGWFRSRL